MRQLQLLVELLQLVFSYVSQHRSLPRGSDSNQRQYQGHEQCRDRGLSNPSAVVMKEKPCKDIRTCATVCSMWHASALWFLFRSPRLTEKPAIRRFIDMLSSAKLARTRWAAVASARVDGSNNSSGGNTSQVSNIYLSSKFIPYPGNAVQDLDLSLLTGSQSIITGSFPCGNLDSQLAVPLCLEANAENLQRIYLHFLFSHSVVLDLTGRSARLCEFDLCRPPIRKRHNLVIHPDAKVGPIFKDARTIINMANKANQQGCAMDFPDWIVLPSTYLHRLGLKNCRITDESIMATFPKGVSALQMRLLDLSGCKFLSDDAVDRIAAACPMLQRLSLDRCIRITDCAVAALAVAPLARTLMFLTLSNCNRVSLGGLLCLYRCLALTFLDLSQMASIPSHQLLALFRPDGDLRHVTTFKT
ncbi:hypothetical protein BASA50_006864 [Batrachochytrium salamandrivorans]|uniref:F-box/LRR-repeat protein 15-like leucin rich repeat domain-containing protein n=1 Tax=Batrachochytrium salamandrivorans TaxID=1357716 RepID=A0ABQ8FA02_9FUNG|nr:hypothetical protein BASA50_006864 [Batrachochytrium salamandrivorans]